MNVGSSASLRSRGRADSFLGTLLASSEGDGGSGPRIEVPG